MSNSVMSIAEALWRVYYAAKHHLLALSDKPVEKGLLQEALLTCHTWLTEHFETYEEEEDETNKDQDS